MTIVAVLGAVQWDVEQVTDDPALVEAHHPILVLDNEGDARVMFVQSTGDFVTQLDLKVASNVTGSWEVSQVARLAQDTLVVFGLDVDENGNSWVAFSDNQEDQFDIFFAADTGGEFVVTNITNSVDVQANPVLKLDSQDTPHIVFSEKSGDQTRFVYGWIDQEGLHSQLVKEEFNTGLETYDLATDLFILPHIFYTDQYLWYTHLESELWIFEQLTDEYSSHPSALIDDAGNLHVAYNKGEGIRCFHQTDGFWEDDSVVETLLADVGHERPSLAIDNQDKLHLAWLYGSMLPITDEIHYGSKGPEVWSECSIEQTENMALEIPGYGHYFAVDAAGYGHIAWAAEDDNEIKQIYYAKTTESLNSGIAEEPAGIETIKLTVTGETILFSLPRASSVRLDLFDTAGRMVRPLISGTYPAGEHEVKIEKSRLSVGCTSCMVCYREKPWEQKSSCIDDIKKEE